MRPDELEIKEIRLRTDNGYHVVRCMQLAVHRHDDMIVLLSVAGPQTAIKSIAATLNSNVRSVFRVNHDFWPITQYGTRLSRKTEFKPHPKQGTYRIATHPLGYNNFHMTAILKTEGILPCVSEEAVWNELNSPRYSTPLLRAWMPYLMEELTRRSLLVTCNCFQCEAGQLLADSEQLDALVEDGLQTGNLSVPREEALCDSSR